MTKEQIEAYLQKNDYITLGVTKEELEKDGGARYFELLTLLEQNTLYGRKFCGKMHLSFKNFAVVNE